jgi:hypothetical protein
MGLSWVENASETGLVMLMPRHLPSDKVEIPVVFGLHMCADFSARSLLALESTIPWSKKKESTKESQDVHFILNYWNSLD